MLLPTHLNLRRGESVHFIGIGGVSMSGLAEMLHSQGRAVSGSDSRRSALTEGLEQKGVKVFIGHRAENVRPGTGLVVYTAAISPDNPELMAAERANIPVMDRARLLGLVMRDYPYPICVAGTHGKTTTTGMLADIFLAAGRDPAINLGGVLPSIGSNTRAGSDGVFIAEACEYHDSFLSFFPYVGVILNVEADHLDYFRDLAHIRASFRRFAENIRPDGALIINAAIPDAVGLARGLPCRVITFGGPGADYYAENLTRDGDGFPSFDVVAGGETLFRASLNLRGEHNVADSLAAIAAAHFCGLAPRDIQAGLTRFHGAKRRFEQKGTIKGGGVTIVDDYAHHPTEIAATLAAARLTRHRRLFVVFQPHTYTRTKLFLNELADSFTLADHVSLLDIYAAREKDTGEIHSMDLLSALKRRGVRADYFQTFEHVEKFLYEKCVQGDLLITMGAGDVYLVGERLLHTDLSKLSTENG